MTGYSLRPFRASEQEYRALASLLRAVSPEGRPESSEDLKREDLEWPSSSLLQRVVAYTSREEMAAVGACFQAYWLDSLSTIYLKFDVHPDHPQVHLLPILFESLHRLLTEHTSEFRRLVARAREDDSDRVGFLVENGFREEMRSPSSALQVAEFDESICERAYARLAQCKVRMITLTEFCNEEPEWKRKLRDLRWEIVRDVPTTEPFAKPTIAEFEEMVLRDPALDVEAFFIAQAEDGALIGMSNLWRNDPEGKRLDTGLTGVIRSYRRRGIATALKVQTIRYAQANGAETIETSNEEESPMYTLNLRLGFKPKPAWVDYTREE
ncbi:MAG: GNAT family N-acetyltransferase [Caldilineaceae bacterium]|nr:GNAT family N-acetyltransferase [Caldilineaceae bacterium]